jgi:hypothetical protein
MNGRRIVPGLLAITLAAAPALMAQSPAPYAPRRGLPPVESDSGRSALRSVLAGIQQDVTALTYLAAHPMSVANHTLPLQHLMASSPAAAAVALDALPRVECPMPVAKSLVPGDSMPVSGVPSAGIESMPAAAQRCVNPLGPATASRR